jgi:hypothetical protein
MKIGILKLPQTFNIVNTDSFIVQTKNTSSPEGVTQQIVLRDLLFGNNNTTFSDTLSANSTNTQFLSTTLTNLSSDTVSLFKSLSTYAVSIINDSFNSSKYEFYPVNSIRYTTTFVNPSLYFPGTEWVQVAQGNYIAGVGNTYSNGVPYNTGDVNGDQVTINPGNSATNTTAGNFNLGEYGHQLTVGELPAHTHDGSFYGETNASIAGIYTESQLGPAQVGLEPITTDATGLSAFHNNMPPMYGLYVWKRIK